MIRELVFPPNDPHAATRLMLLHQGLCISHKTHKPRDLDTLRREGTLKAKLESISDPDDTIKIRFEGGIYNGRKLKPEGGTIQIDKSEFKMLEDYVPENTWTVEFAGQIADAVDWVLTAPEVKESSPLKAVASAMLLLLLLSGSVSAQSLAMPRATFWTAVGADISTTVIGVRQGYADSNPFIVNQPTAVVVPIMTALAVEWAARRIHQQGHPHAARAILWMCAGIRTGFVIANLQTIRSGG